MSARADRAARSEYLRLISAGVDEQTAATLCEPAAVARHRAWRARAQDPPRADQADSADTPT